MWATGDKMRMLEEMWMEGREKDEWRKRRRKEIKSIWKKEIKETTRHTCDQIYIRTVEVQNEPDALMQRQMKRREDGRGERSV